MGGNYRRVYNQQVSRIISIYILQHLLGGRRNSYGYDRNAIMLVHNDNININIHVSLTLVRSV